MRNVNVSISGNPDAEAVPGLTFTVLPSEIVVSIPGSREPIFSVATLEHPLLNQQTYNLYVEGYSVDLLVSHYHENPVEEGEPAEVGEYVEGC
jgi:hypothetical protein